MTILNLNVIIYLKLLTMEEVKTMKYFLIEGIVTHPERMTNEMMQEHQKYTNLLMKAGKVLFSSLKSDMSSSITVIKSRNEIEIQEFYKHEPLFNNNVLSFPKILFFIPKVSAESQINFCHYLSKISIASPYVPKR